MDVVLATDRAYLPWCATTILSAVRATSDVALRVHVLHLGDLTDDDRRRLAAMGDLAVVAVDPARLDGMPSKGPQLGGSISWVRVVVPDVLPGVERAVYLDADTLVLESLGPLGTVDLHGQPVGAVANVVEPAMRHHVDDLGVAAYFNAGVLVMDLAALRAEGATEALGALARRRGDELTWFDQDALNVHFNGRWHALPPRWNPQNSFWSWPVWAAEVLGERDLADAVARPAVVHFEGPALCKPWHYLCQSPFQARYRDALAATPWPDAPVQERTLLNRVIARLPRHRQVPAYVRTQRLLARVGRSRL